MSENMALAAYKEKRDLTDIDLVFNINKLIVDIIGNPTSERFLSDPIIEEVKDKKPLVQRIMINKYFLEKLLIYRSTHNVDVSDMLMLLINDGEIKDWFKMLQEYIIPFCNIHEVL